MTTGQDETVQEINGLGMVLTGDKSVVGIVIAFILASGFNWKVHYQRGETTTLRQPRQNSKRQGRINRILQCRWWRRHDSHLRCDDIVMQSRVLHHQAELRS